MSCLARAASLSLHRSGAAAAAHQRLRYGARDARRGASKSGGTGPRVTPVAEVASGPLGRRWRDEHVPIEGVVGLAGRMEAEAEFALVADHDAGDFVAVSVDGVSFG